MRAFARGTIVVGALLATGCYTLQPVATAAPLDGREMAFDITDAGRVALGGAMGPSILRVEGRLLRRDGDTYVVAVSAVDFIGGGSQRWSGESVQLKREYVATSYERRLSKSRTIAASAIGLGAVAFIVTRSLIGSGNGDTQTDTSRVPTGTAIRIPLPD